MTSKNTEVRVAAIVGPFGSGKTSLTESLLYVTGAVDRKGTAGEANRAGDASPECRKFAMSAEAVASGTRFLGEPWVFLDCPGAPELGAETYHALNIADAAVVVCDPNPERAVTAAPLLKLLQSLDIPHFIFINKVENSTLPVREVINALQEYSHLPLVLREIPIRENGTVTGFVDLISERAYAFKDGEYKENVSAHLVKIPENVDAKREEARQKILENLADRDDAVLEKILEDALPAKSELFSSLANAVRENALVPVFFGAAEKDAGIFRLLKALRHDVACRKIQNETLKDARVAVSVFKTKYAHTGKQSVARVLKGTLNDGMVLGNVRINGLYDIRGVNSFKIDKATQGALVALGRMDEINTGDILTEKSKSSFLPALSSCMYAAALEPEKAGDEVKLTSAAAKLAEEDPSLFIEYDKDTEQMLLWAQGKRHAELFLARLKSRFNVRAKTVNVKTPLKEKPLKTVRKSAKKQSGKHGTDIEIELEISPADQNSGITVAFDGKAFKSVPINQETLNSAVYEALLKGNSGHPVTDVDVKILSMNMNKDVPAELFKNLLETALNDALKESGTVLLEPVWKIEISVPSTFTTNMRTVLAKRKAGISEIVPDPVYRGWDILKADLPFSALVGFAEEMRSVSMGTANCVKNYSYLKETPIK